MLNRADISNTLAADSQGVARLRQAAQQNSPQALRTVAHQFEALFTEMMLKSMRDATPQDGVFDNDQTRLYTSMLDQQLSQNLANKGIGLADMLVRQLSPSSPHPAGRFVLPHSPGAGTAAQPAVQDSPAASSGAPAAGPGAPTSGREHAFMKAMHTHAEAASRASGIPARFMLGQAALESGWGSKEVVGTDGTRSHNLFGIKAGADWHGKTVKAVTTEYVNGVAQKRVATFRAYNSYADSFNDYASFLRSNPRYRQVLAGAQSPEQFARGLQQAGYATDPHYADKLGRILSSPILA